MAQETGHFIIIGAQKSGTTSLYAMLQAHDMVGMSWEKETNYFCRDGDGPGALDTYLEQFPRDRAWRGEASPLYTMAHEFPGVPGRIAAAFPEARLIYILRDPVERAVSQYKHEYLSGQTRLEGAALEGSEDLARYIETSRFAAQLDPFLEVFPRERVLILDFAQLRTDPQGIMDAICAHLDIPQIPVGEGGAKNSGEERERTPEFILRYWGSPAFVAARRMAPKAALRRAKALIQKLPRRQVPPVTPVVRTQITAGVRDDAARIREISGLPFGSWSV